MRSLLCYLILLLILLGCVTQEVEVTKKDEPRVVLVVLAGDNSLSNEVAWRMDALSEGWDERYMGPLFVLADSKEREVPILYRLVYDGGKQWIQERCMIHFENSASDGPWLATFDYLLSRIHPNARIGLVIFSHGSGWLPKGSLARPRSFIEDNRREMSLDDLISVLPEDRLDYVIFDMCLTAGVEVAYAFRDKVPYMIVSSAEMLSPGFLPLYKSHLSFLYDPVPEGLIAWSKEYANYVEQQEDILYRSGTLSVLDLSVIDGLAEWVRLYDKGIIGDEVEHFDRTAGVPLFYDLGEYLALQGGDEESLTILLDSLVLHKWHSKTFLNRPIKSHSGLTVFIPSSFYPYLNMRYKETAWWKATKRNSTFQIK